MLDPSTSANTPPSYTLHRNRNAMRALMLALALAGVALALSVFAASYQRFNIILVVMMTAAVATMLLYGVYSAIRRLSAIYRRRLGARAAIGPIAVLVCAAAVFSASGFVVRYALDLQRWSSMSAKAPIQISTSCKTPLVRLHQAIPDSGRFAVSLLCSGSSIRVLYQTAAQSQSPFLMIVNAGVVSAATPVEVKGLSSGTFNAPAETANEAKLSSGGSFARWNVDAYDDIAFTYIKAPYAHVATIIKPFLFAQNWGEAAEIAAGLLLVFAGSVFVAAIGGNLKDWLQSHLPLHKAQTQ